MKFEYINDDSNNLESNTKNQKEPKDDMSNTNSESTAENQSFEKYYSDTDCSEAEEEQLKWLEERKRQIEYENMIAEQQIQAQNPKIEYSKIQRPLQNSKSSNMSTESTGNCINRSSSYISGKATSQSSQLMRSHKKENTVTDNNQQYEIILSSSTFEFQLSKDKSHMISDIFEHKTHIEYSRVSDIEKIIKIEKRKSIWKVIGFSPNVKYYILIKISVNLNDKTVDRYCKIIKKESATIIEHIFDNVEIVAKDESQWMYYKITSYRGLP